MAWVSCITCEVCEKEEEKGREESTYTPKVDCRENKRAKDAFMLIIFVY